jgi:glycerophosphoryl diester phosphodiesterase
VVAHSHELAEITDGQAHGAIEGWSLDEVRAVAPGLPTLEETVAWFASEAPGVGLHVDLKLGTRLDELGVLLERHGVAGRAVVSTVDPAALHRVRASCPGVRLGLTYPNDRLGVAGRPYMRLAVRAGLSALRASLPVRLPRMLRRAGAGALMLQYRLVSPAAVARAHAAGVPVLAWTVDEPADLEHVVGPAWTG